MTFTFVFLRYSFLPSSSFTTCCSMNYISSEMSILRATLASFEPKIVIIIEKVIRVFVGNQNDISLTFDIKLCT